jgi:PhzF family phenazine biosynthesis protein
MTRSRLFLQVDVFTDRPYYGNALAVVLDAADVSEAAMQRFAMWTNLAETTFILPPTPEAAAAGADYQLRIFTTAYEMPFAGHPTLGSCHAWLATGGVPKNADCIVQQCEVGLVRLRREGTRLAFAAPALRRTGLSTAVLAALQDALGLRPEQVLASQQLVNGPSHIGLLLDSMHTVLELAPDFGALKTALALGGCSGVGVAALASGEANSGLIRRSNREARAFGTRAAHAQPEAKTAEKADLEVRMFVSDLNVSEDPITGSFNASLAQWLIADGHAPKKYVAAQGTCIGREGRVFIEQDLQGQVWVGGDSVTCIEGTVSL